MTKVKVKTTAVINRNPVGSLIELSEESANKLVGKGYVEIIEKVKETVVEEKSDKANKDTAPKKPKSKDEPKPTVKKETPKKAKKK